MLERRRFPRTKVFKGAKVILAGHSTISCVVRDLSNHGAGLQFTSTAELRAEFDLSFDTGRTLRECRVAWQTRTSAGVSFEQPTEVIRQSRPSFNKSQLFGIALKLVFTGVVVANMLRWRARGHSSWIRSITLATKLDTPLRPQRTIVVRPRQCEDDILAPPRMGYRTPTVAH